MTLENIQKHQEKLRYKFLKKGVQMIAPETVFFSKDTVIGKNVTIGHKVILHGSKIGENSIIGMGSVLMNNSTIGENCILGANSLVTEGKQFPANSLIMGSPAKVVRELSEDEIQFLKLSAEHYVEKSKLFKQDLKHET